MLIYNIQKKKEKGGLINELDFLDLKLERNLSSETKIKYVFIYLHGLKEIGFDKLLFVQSLILFSDQVAVVRTSDLSSILRDLLC